MPSSSSYILRRLCVAIACLAGIFAVQITQAAADEAKINPSEMFVAAQGTGETSERAKTINDINNFLISSYKLKVDRVLSDLNASISKATNNDLDAQIQLLKKIQGDIAVKEALLKTHPISQNRKKILEAIFTHIQMNLSETIRNISRTAGEKQ